MRKIATTPTVLGSTEPNWSYETCVLFPSVQENLVFQVFHRNLIFKNDLLGTASLQLDKLSSAEKGIEVRLPLGKANGELVVLVRILPVYAGMPLESTMFYSARPYSNIRLHLERFVYVPGELVRGNVIFNAGEASKKLDWIHLETLGKTHLDFRSAKSLGLPGSEDFASKCFITPLEFIWWSVRATVAGLAPDGTGQKISVASGVHVWPFEFVLPNRLPPTYTRVSFWSSYTIQLHAQMPDGKVISASKDIAVVPLLVGLQPTLFTSILAAVSSDIAVPSAQPIAVGWNAPDVALIGIPFDVAFQVQNSSTHNFTSFSCHLRTIRIYNVWGDSGRGWMANKFLEEIAALSAGGVASPSGTVVNGSLSMIAQNTQMAQCCYPSIPEATFSDLVQVHHYLELIGITDTNAKVSCGKKPIFITYSQFLPPFASSNELEPTPSEVPPAVMRVAKSTYEQSLQLCIPQGHWVHMDYRLTQGRSNATMPHFANTSFVLPHAVFEALNPTTPPQTKSLTSKTIPFPFDQPTPIHLEHAESFEGNPQHQRKNDAGSVAINQYGGVNLNFQSFGLNDLNKQLFGGSFGK
jgi:hypothetical protein